MDRDERLIREWEQRLHQHRTCVMRHLIVSVAVAAGIVVGLVLALDENTAPGTATLILTLLCLVVAAYAVSRLGAVREARALGGRIRCLEDEIEVGGPLTIHRLHRSLYIALTGAVVLLAVIAYILFTHSPDQRTEDIPRLRDEMVRHAYKYRGVPYQWGGDYPETGVDCSGFARCMLQEFNLLPDGDYGAQALHDHYRDYRTRRMKPGNLIFFGDTDTSITHVGILIDHMRMIDASGGSSLSSTLATALSRDAKVGVTRIDSRYNPVAVVDPFAEIAGEDDWIRVRGEDSVWSEQILRYPDIVVGDADDSGELDLADVAFLIDHVFEDGIAPNPPFSGDVDCTGEIDSEDIVYLMAYVLGGGAAPCDAHRMMARRASE